MQHEIIKVSEYNRRGKLEYAKELKEWHSEKGKLPYYGKYVIFNGRSGPDRKTGWVLTVKNKVWWRKTKRECIEFLNYLERKSNGL